MNKNTVKYVAGVAKDDVNGAGGFQHQYYIWASDSADDGYRIISVMGPEATAFKDHWLSNEPDEEAEIKKHIRSWYPHLDKLNFNKA